MFDYWLLTRKKNPIIPKGTHISGGLMTAGIKPSELPSGNQILSADPNATNPPQREASAATPASQAIVERD